MSKQALQIARNWGKERVQWGQPIGKHEAGAVKIANMAASTFAQEAMTYYTSALVDKGGADIRLEAAMAKLFCSEASWKIMDDLMQLRGGRGYETGPILADPGRKGLRGGAHDARLPHQPHHRGHHARSSICSSPGRRWTSTCVWRGTC